MSQLWLEREATEHSIFISCTDDVEVWDNDATVEKRLDRQFFAVAFTSAAISGELERSSSFFPRYINLE